jgi:hypothetical protein
MIVTPQNLTPRCSATVELASSTERPYRFAVTVVGEYPHPFRRVYTVIGPRGADCESAADSCAIKGLELFCAEFGPKLPGIATVPKVRLA